MSSFNLEDKNMKSNKKVITFFATFTEFFDLEDENLKSNIKVGTTFCYLYIEKKFRNHNCKLKKWTKQILQI